MHVLVKKTLLLLCATALVLAPMFSYSKEYPVRKAVFEDESVLLYQCESKSSVKFVLTIPSGQVYKGTLFCGDVV